MLREDEYIAAIEMPLAAVRRPHRFYKVTKRFEDDISSVMLALSALPVDGKLTELRVAYGGMAAVPLRVASVETLLEGRAIDETLLAQAQACLNDALTPLSDVRASADYRAAVAGNLLRRGLLALSGADEEDLFTLPREGVRYA